MLTGIFNLRFMDTMQIHALFGLGTAYVTTRKRLSRLTREGYLNGWQPSKNDYKVYYVTKKGAQEVALLNGYDFTPAPKRSNATLHQVLVTEVYVQLRQCQLGRIGRFSLNTKVGESVADAFVEYVVGDRIKVFFLKRTGGLNLCPRLPRS